VYITHRFVWDLQLTNGPVVFGISNM